MSSFLLMRVLELGLFAVMSSAAAAGCVDTPITAAHLEDDGRLRPGVASSMVGRDMRPEPVEAQALQLTAVLASQPRGPLQDKTQFALTDQTVHLHVRVDDLDTTRPVTFVWNHAGNADVEVQRYETMGFLAPSDTLSRVTSLELGPDQAGSWTLQIFEAGTSDPALLFERAFDVVDPNAPAIAPS